MESLDFLMLKLLSEGDEPLKQIVNNLSEDFTETFLEIDREVLKKSLREVTADEETDSISYTFVFSQNKATSKQMSEALKEIRETIYQLVRERL